MVSRSIIIDTPVIYNNNELNKFPKLYFFKTFKSSVYFNFVAEIEILFMIDHE